MPGILDNRQTSFQLTFGGIPFSLDTPEVIEWIEQNIPLEDLRETILPTNPLTGAWAKNLSGLAVPLLPERPTKIIGRFFYPSGLARWAEFTGLMTASQLSQVVSQIYNSDGSPKALPFIMQSDVPANNVGDQLSSGGFTTNMFMLPPRFLGGWGSSHNSGGPSPLDELFLVTLVDDRFYGTYTAAQKVMPDGVMTWDTLISTLATALGITFNPALPAIDSVYGKPSQDSPIWSMYESAAYLLEAALQNVGRTVVRNFDGTYQAPKHTESVTTITTSANLPPMTLAGGDMYYKAFANTRPNHVIPNSITVTFPRFLQGAGFIDTRDPSDIRKQSYGDVWTENVTLSQAGTPWTTYAGKGNRVFHDTARACYTNATDATPNNETALRALAVQMTKDYLAILQTALDLVWPGIRAWVPEGFHDVIWTYRGNIEQASTRIFRKPWNYGSLEFQHTLGCDAGSPTTSNAIVCCQASNGTTTLYSGSCPPGTTPVPISQCVSNPIPNNCCQFSDGTTILVTGPCPAGSTPVDITLCQGQLHCCQFSLGSPPELFNGPCPPGSVQVDISLCNPEPGIPTCCQFTNGSTVLMPPGQPCPPGSAPVDIGKCKAINPNPLACVDSCSITLECSAPAIGVKTIIAYWNGFCVNGTKVGQPAVTDPNRPGVNVDCRYSCENTTLAPPQYKAGNVDLLEFDSCAFEVEPLTDACCGDNNTIGIRLTTVGETIILRLLDNNCNCLELCFRDGLLKVVQAC